MTSLQLLGEAYESNSSSDSENEIRKTTNQEQQNKTKLPLPDAIGSLFEDKAIVTSDPSKHQGRTRSFAHERGNWATYVCLPYPEENSCELRHCVQQVINDMCDPVWNIVDDFHLSISKTIPIPHHFIDPFVESLQESFSQSHFFEITLSSSDLRCYVNDEKTRSFIGFEVTAMDLVANIKSMVDKVDATMLDFRCATYYEEPSYHISIAWCLGDVTKHACYNDIMVTMQQMWLKIEQDRPELFTFKISEAVLKSGNKKFSFHLRPP